jgi:hypothetical protein
VESFSTIVRAGTLTIKQAGDSLAIDVRAVFSVTVPQAKSLAQTWSKRQIARCLHLLYQQAGAPCLLVEQQHCSG